jgi:Asp-tRNA(Asn)/Glu-tRNA(Gln) amidotransferase A subunit family amidase
VFPFKPHAKVQRACLTPELINNFNDLLAPHKNSRILLPKSQRGNVATDPALTPAWRKAVHQLEKDRATDVLSALPAPPIPAANPPLRSLKSPDRADHSNHRAFFSSGATPATAHTKV